MDEGRRRVRRLRIALAVLTGTVLVGAGALGGAATALSWDGLLSPGPSWDDRYTITSYDTTGTLNDDGSLSVVEDIEVEWHEPRRGLVRDIDRSGPAGELTVDDIDVASRTQDDVWFEVRVDEDTERQHSVHLGEEVDFRPLGSDHYRITYDLAPMLVEVDGGPTVRWDTFGDQWDTLIEQATVSLELPAGDHDLGCVVGARGQAFACDGDAPSWSAQELRPGRGMTVEAQLEPGSVDATGLPSAELGPLEEFSTLALQRLALIVALVSAAALPLLGTVGTPGTWQRRRRARERIDTTGVAYAPPRDMRPLTASVLVAGEAHKAQDDELFAAWLLDAQQRGLIEARPEKKGFSVRPTRTGAPASQAEATALQALTSDGDGWNVWDGKTPQARRTAFEKAWQELRAHHVFVAGVPARVASRTGVLGGVLLVLGLLAAWWLWGVTPIGGIALGAGVLGCWGASTVTDRALRTAVADLDDVQLASWREVEGLRRFVAEAHAEQISGLADDPTVPLTTPFLELLPWVVALGHGEQWAERFDVQIRAATEQHGVYAPVRSGEIRQVRSVARPTSSDGGSGGSGGSGVGSGGGGGGGGSR